MKYTIKAVVLCIGLLALSTVLLQACGKEKVSAPDGSTITINPAAVTAAISADTCYNFAVTVKYLDETPMPGASLTIYGGFAEPRNATNTNARYQFYAEANCANPQPSGFRVPTDKFGVYRFSINAYGLVNNVANSFIDNIEVFSGSAYAAANITIN